MVAKMAVNLGMVSKMAANLCLVFCVLLFICATRATDGLDWSYQALEESGKFCPQRDSCRSVNL